MEEPGFDRKSLKKYRGLSEMELDIELDRLEDEVELHEERTQSTMMGNLYAPVVRAYIQPANVEKVKHRGLRGWVRSIFRRKREQTGPASITNQDLPVELDGKTLQADMSEGEIFGEMSCLNRTARAAICVATISFETYPYDVEDWTDFQARTFNRLVLELVFPGRVPRKLERGGVPRVVRYVGRGEYFGEMGLVQRKSRSATCIAMSQPNLGQSKASQKWLVGSRTELVRLRRAQFDEWLASDPSLKGHIEHLMSERKIGFEDHLRQLGTSLRKTTWDWLRARS